MPTLSGCPKNISVTTDSGQAYARVTWTAPKFIDREFATVLNTRTHSPGDRYAMHGRLIPLRLEAFIIVHK